MSDNITVHTHQQPNDASCDECGGWHNERTYAHGKWLCDACYAKAKAANDTRTDIPPCGECGAALVRRPEEHPSRNGTFFLDCPDCDRTYVAFVNQPVHPWHEHQPKCECGQFARYFGRPVAFGKLDPDEVWLYRCRGCGRKIEVRTDRLRTDGPESEQPPRRPPRVRVLKEPS